MASTSGYFGDAGETTLAAVAEKESVRESRIAPATLAYLGLAADGKPREGGKVPLRVAADLLGVGSDTAKAERVFWRAEPVVVPSLRIGSAEGIVAAYRAGVRADRIARRAGIGSRAASDRVYRDATGNDPKTVRRAKGRPFAETRAGELSVAEGAAYRAAVRSARVGDAEAERTGTFGAGERETARVARALLAASREAERAEAEAPKAPDAEAPAPPRKRSRRAS